MYGASAAPDGAGEEICGRRHSASRILLGCITASWLALAAPPAGAADLDVCTDGGTSPALTEVEFLRSYHAGLHAPSRLALDASGNLYVADPARNQVVVRAPDGRVLDRRLFPAQPDAIAVDDGNSRPIAFYIGESAAGRVTAYASDWQPVLELGQGAGEFVSVNDIAVDPTSGAVYVADGTADLIKIYAPGGAFLGSFGGHGAEPGQFSFPAALAVDALRRELLVVDQLNFRVQIFDLDGDINDSFICRLGAATSSPSCTFCRTRLFSVPAGIAVDPAGRIYVADASDGRVRVVDRDGTARGQIGAFGAGKSQLRVPLDIAIDTYGRVFVSDSNNSRLAVYGIEDFADPEAYAPADAVVTPDPFDRDGTDPLFTALIEIPGYPLSGVLLESITANGVALEPGSAEIGNRDGDREPDIRATFDREALAATLPVNGQGLIEVEGMMGALNFHAPATITVIGTVVDGDGDGITDDIDRCLGTPPATAIDQTGCAIVQLCPCGARLGGQPWASHGDYVTCTTGEAGRFADAGLIGRAEIGGIVKAAARAQCPGAGG